MDLDPDGSRVGDPASRRLGSPKRLSVSLRLSARPQSPEAPHRNAARGRQPRPRVGLLQSSRKAAAETERRRAPPAATGPDTTARSMGVIRGSIRISASWRVERAADRPVRGRGQTIRAA